MSFNSFHSNNHSSLPPAASLANISCLLLIVFGASVAYVASRPPTESKPVASTDPESNVQNDEGPIKSEDVSCVNTNGTSTEEEDLSLKPLQEKEHLKLVEGEENKSGNEINSLDTDLDSSKKAKPLYPDIELSTSEINAECSSDATESVKEE